MGMGKAVTLSSGVTVNYWRITRINEDFNGETQVFVGGYVSKELRDSNATPVVYRDFVFDLRDATRAKVYAKLQELPEFADAELV